MNTDIENLISSYVDRADYRGLVSKFTRKPNKIYLDTLISIMLSNGYNIDVLKKTSQIIYHFINNIKEIPICKQCMINKRSYKNINIGYFEFCSCKCKSSNKEIKEKCIESNIIKYGTSHYANTIDFKSRMNDIRKSKKIGFGSIEYQKTIQDRYGVDNISKLPEIKSKKSETCFRKYGLYSLFSDKKLMSDYNLKKYGYSFYIPEELKSDFRRYHESVWRVTKRNKKKLLENWNGHDYYDNEYIKDNYNLHYNNLLYPTIDHKISIYYGFNNNISYEIIADINNLCLTKRSINNSFMCHKKFT